MAFRRLTPQRDGDEPNVGSDDLRRALWLNQFDVHYQPLIDLSTGGLAGAEALLRWRHPQRGVLSAAAFLPSAVETEHIHSLGRQVMERAIRFRGAWGTGEQSDVRIAINLSGPELVETDLADTVTGLAREAGISPKLVEIGLDVTSLEDIRDAARTSAVALAETGVTISLDDLDALPDGFERMDGFPAGSAQIDMHHASDPNDPRKLERLVEASHERGIEVVAKRVETHEHLVALRELGVQRAMGFLLGQPVSQREFAGLLSDARVREAGAGPAVLPQIEVRDVQWGGQPAARSA
jgi:EAL domain-containing protein (putative c-di-GMP-specific phosphodiesterase class I)